MTFGLFPIGAIIHEAVMMQMTRFLNAYRQGIQRLHPGARPNFKWPLSMGKLCKDLLRR